MATSTKTKLPLLDLPTSPTKINRVIAWWMVLLIMKDVEWGLIFGTLTNANISNVAAK
jgi:hypothetical protein